MRRVLTLFLAFVLLFQTSWAVAATYCAHESSPKAALHFGHHAHVHASESGKTPPGGALAQHDDCAFCHAVHAAIVPLVAAVVAAPLPSSMAFPEPILGASASVRAPDRPQWLRLA